MFRWLGQNISHTWPIWLTSWVIVLVVLWSLAPPWVQVAVDEDIALLRADSPSRIAEDKFRQAFPDSLAASNIAILIHRPGTKGAFLDADKRFVSDVLEPALRKISGLAEASKSTTEDNPFSDDAAAPVATGPVLRIRTPNATGVGDLLISSDREAMIVALELSGGFMAETNKPVIAAVENLLAEMQSSGAVPTGTHIDLTGSAVIGRDHRHAERQGARSTEKLTIALVIVLLLLIYRSPVVALIPLLTVAIAVKLSLSLLALLANAGIVGLFPGIEVYVTVLAYGAGVDFTLFLIARYKERLDAGRSMEVADAEAIGGVGATITASAATVICGLGTLALAEFGKFREAGIAIAVSLTIVWLAALTLSPTLLRLAGRWSFWPRRLISKNDSPAKMSEVATDPCGTVYPRRFRAGWEWAIGHIACRPAIVMGLTTASLIPFAVVALVCYNRVSYNLVGNLPKTSPSVAGTRALEAHFPAGMIGQVSVLVINRDQDFRKSEGRNLINALTEQLRTSRDEFGLADVRSLTAPLGLGSAMANLPASTKPEAVEAAAQDTYVSSMDERGAPGMRLDFVFHQGPFEDATVASLGRLESLLKRSLPPKSEIYTFGTTATVRDLQGVMQRDRNRVQLFVLLGVSIVLVILLRQFVVPLYLILSVLLSYYATLGVTFVVFWALDPAGFVGLDWKVTVFLFAILIAVGEDYNIFLVTRVAEEQAKFGLVPGVTEALVRTGPIISSCGVIMAGTFASLLAGSLREMQQLGFALALGVLLDTFVVRPVLVPAFLILIYRRKRASEKLHQEKEMAGAT